MSEVDLCLAIVSLAVKDALNSLEPKRSHCPSKFGKDAISWINGGGKTFKICAEVFEMQPLRLKTILKKRIYRKKVINLSEVK